MEKNAPYSPGIMFGLFLGIMIGAVAGFSLGNHYRIRTTGADLTRKIDELNEVIRLVDENIKERGQAEREADKARRMADVVGIRAFAVPVGQMHKTTDQRCIPRPGIMPHGKVIVETDGSYTSKDDTGPPCPDCGKVGQCLRAK